MANPWMNKYKANDPFKKKDIIPGGGGYRDIPEDPYVGPGEPFVPSGQGQFGPGWQSTSNWWVDMAGAGEPGGGVYDNYMMARALDWSSVGDVNDLAGAWGTDITNMDDFYNWWSNWNDDPDSSFMDFFNDLGQWGYPTTHMYSDAVGGGAPSTGLGWGLHMGGPGSLYTSGSAMVDYDFGSDYDNLMGQNAGMWGGNIGGQGDLGQGNVFIGGGMSNLAYGGEMSGQDCASLGPQFNSAGECIACCGEQYASTGFYGTGGEGWSPENESIDPDFNLECYSQYEATMGAGYEGSYEEFAGLYC